jgi:hypothetical protein
MRLGIDSNNPQNFDQCNLCHGNMDMPDKYGKLQLCPKCDGLGSYMPPYNRIPFWYTIGNGAAVVLAASAGGGVAGASAPANLTILGQYDFEAWFMMAISNPGGTAGAWQDQFGDDSYQWQPFNTFIVNSLRWGTAQFPLPLKPRIWMPRLHNFKWTGQDLSGATNTLQMAFYGYDLHPIIAIPKG